MKNLIVIISLIFVFNGKTVIDYKLHSSLLLNAYRSVELDQHDKAYKLYKEAFELNGFNKPNDYAQAALTAARLIKKENCVKWLEQAIIKKNVRTGFLTKFSGNKLYRECLAKVLTNYKNLQQQFFDNVENPVAYYKIQKLINRDQFVRKMNTYYTGISEQEKEKAFEDYIIAQSKNDTIVMAKLWNILRPKVDKTNEEYKTKVMKNADSLNVKELIEITNEHGWYEEGWLILWHQRHTFDESNWVWNYFKPLIDSEIKKGNVAPYYWAIFEDFISIRDNGESVYGYHPGKVNSKIVNTKRKEIGLPSLNEGELEYRNNNSKGGRVF